MNLKRGFYRSIKYYDEGFRVFGRFLSLLNFCTTFFYLAVGNSPILQSVFPKYRVFLLIVGFFSLPFAIITGYIYVKRLKFHRTNYEVEVEVNPYASKKVTPIQIPLYTALIKLFEKEGIDVTELNKVLEASK